MTTREQSLRTCPDCERPLATFPGGLDLCGHCISAAADGEPDRYLGRYRVDRELGRGSAGRVYLAFDESLQREVAIKALTPELVDDAQLLGRFRKEARALARLSHQNIISVFGFEQVADEWLLVMEYFGDQTLAERLKDERPLKIEQIADYGEQIANGLAAAHQRGVVHRDLKPANLLIAGNRLKIADFGLAKRDLRSAGRAARGSHRNTDVLTQTGLVVGTLPYMSPEQARGHSVDHRTDLFSLGILLYELVTGERPFSGETTFTLMTSILTDSPPPLRQVRPETPRQLEQLVSLLLRKQPDQRRISAAEVGERLSRLRRPGRGTRWVNHLRDRLAKMRRSRRPPHGWTRTGGGGDGSRLQTLGVLPLRNRSTEGLDYLRFGVADGLALRLGENPAIDVRRSESMRRLSEEPAQALSGAELLGIDWLVHGELDGNIEELSLELELQSTADGRAATRLHVTGSGADLRQELDGAARRIAGHILGTPSDVRPAGPAPSPEADLLVLKGIHSFRQLDRAGLQRARRLFDQACELDPDHPRALAWWAMTRIHGERRQRGGLIQQRALRAVELAPESGELHSILGSVLWLVEWDFGAAAKSFARARDLAPADAMAWGSASLLHSCLGEHEEALLAARRAVDLDPLNPIYGADLARRLLLSGRTDDASAAIDELLDLHPTFELALAFRAQILLAQQRPGEAADLLRRQVSNPRWRSGYLGVAAAQLGDRDTALEEVVALRARPSSAEVQSAMILNALGQREDALNALENALAERDEEVHWLAVEPSFANLRGNRRFRKLLRRIGLPPALWRSTSSTITESLRALTAD